MPQFLGKNDFKLGLTTNTRGQFGNNPVLNICHGYDPTTGDLVPIKSKGSSVETIAFTESIGDYVIEYKNNFYSFTDIINLNYTGTTTVKQFFGDDIALYSKPCISGEQIIYPTNKGLLCYEPLSPSGKSNIRLLSFMSPIDYNRDDNEPTVANGSTTKTKLFDIDNVTAVNGTLAYSKFTDASAANDVIEFTATDNLQAFSFKRPISLSSAYVNGWFIYDLRIENDKQEYLAQEFFENNDVIFSGYEIAFKDTSGNDLYIIGVPLCTQIYEQWYRMVSYFELENPTAVTHIEFRTSYNYQNKNSNSTKIYLGCQDIDVATGDIADQWRYVGNYLYPTLTTIGTYKDIIKRDIDITKSVDYSEKLTNRLFDDEYTGWTVTGDDYEIRTVSYTLDGVSYTKAAWFNDAISSLEQYVEVQPYSYYNMSIYCDPVKDGIGSPDSAIRLSAKFSVDPDKLNKNTENLHTSTLTKFELTNVYTGNNTIMKFLVEKYVERDNQNNYFIAPTVKLSQTNSLYKTSRVLYSYLKDEVFDADNAFKHNTKKYSYSFCGRDTLKTIANYDTLADRYKLMISNPSDDSLTVADDPFTNASLSLTIPNKTINSVTRNAITVYNDYITHVLFYKSSINGATKTETDYSYIGKVAIANSVTFTDDADIDAKPDNFYDIDTYHSVYPEQEQYNDYLDIGKYAINLNGRVYVGNLTNQETALAISTYDKNWAFPASVDEYSTIDTGSQLDNIHSFSSQITSLATISDNVIIFYDKEIIRLWGNDFYSANGYGTTSISRLKSINSYAIANTQMELIFSDGLDFYATTGNSIQNISRYRIKISDIDFTKVSSLFHDNKYYFYCSTKIFVYDITVNCWYTIPVDNIIQLIESYDKIYCLAKTLDTETELYVYTIHELFGTTYSGEKIAETMYQLISNSQFDVTINDIAFEALGTTNENIVINAYTQGQDIKATVHTVPLNTYRVRYNKIARTNFMCNAIKLRVTYTGTKPPTILSLGVIRNDAKSQE